MHNIEKYRIKIHNVIRFKRFGSSFVLDSDNTACRNMNLPGNNASRCSVLIRLRADRRGGMMFRLAGA